MSDHAEGLHNQYRVERLTDPNGKHSDCRYFVLDPQHDPFARTALWYYATRAGAEGFEALRHDLLTWLGGLLDEESA